MKIYYIARRFCALGNTAIIRYILIVRRAFPYALAEPTHGRRRRNSIRRPGHSLLRCAAHPVFPYAYNNIDGRKFDSSNSSGALSPYNNTDSDACTGRCENPRNYQFGRPVKQNRQQFQSDTSEIVFQNVYKYVFKGIKCRFSRRYRDNIFLSLHLVGEEFFLRIYLNGKKKKKQISRTRNNNTNTCDVAARGRFLYAYSKANIRIFPNRSICSVIQTFRLPLHIVRVTL